MGVGIWY